MALKYASQQPPGFINHVKNIAIVGAGGSVGKYFVQGLLRTGKHTVTAITREESTAVFQPPIQVRKVNYGVQNSLVEALRGQDVLILTLPGASGRSGLQERLIEAAAAANVPWVFPNEWGIPIVEATKSVGEDTRMYPAKLETRRFIEKLGKSSWISFCCGFWYEYSLAGTIERYGFDLKGRRVIFIDDGETKINTSTWPQCGRAMASLLSLKVLPEDENDSSPHLSQFANNFVYISSFLVSQKDMFESVKRVAGADGWTVIHEPHKERYLSGVELFNQGNLAGFGRLLYTRVFYPDGSGNFEERFGLHNDILGLPKEDIDEYTKVAIGMAQETFGVHIS